jgi:hypothetical protein
MDQVLRIAGVPGWCYAEHIVEYSIRLRRLRDRHALPPECEELCMAKFFFHLRDHTDQVLDPEGIECPNAAVVEAKAMEAARDIIGNDAKAGAIDMRYRIDVEDTSDRIVHTLEFEDAVSIQRAA